MIDHELDLSRFDAPYKNDDTGAPGYAPSVLLKIVLLAYSRGMVSSRAIERACRENVLFMAISGDSAPQFTTIANFLCELATEIHHVFTQILLICDAQWASFSMLCTKQYKCHCVSTLLWLRNVNRSSPLL